MTDVILEKVVGVTPVKWGATLDTDSEYRQTYIKALRAADKNDYRQLIKFVTN